MSHPAVVSNTAVRRDADGLTPHAQAQLADEYQDQQVEAALRCWEERLGLLPPEEAAAERKAMDDGVATWIAEGNAERARQRARASVTPAQAPSQALVPLTGRPGAQMASRSQHRAPRVAESDEPADPAEPLRPPWAFPHPCPDAVLTPSQAARWSVLEGEIERARHHRPYRELTPEQRAAWTRSGHLFETRTGLRTVSFPLEAPHPVTEVTHWLDFRRGIAGWVCVESPRVGPVFA